MTSIHCHPLCNPNSTPGKGTGCLVIIWIACRLTKMDWLACNIIHTKWEVELNDWYIHCHPHSAPSKELVLWQLDGLHAC